MSFANFTNSENKSIIWALLQEGGIFNDINASREQNHVVSIIGWGFDE